MTTDGLPHQVSCGAPCGGKRSPLGSAAPRVNAMPQPPQGCPAGMWVRRGSVAWVAGRDEGGSSSKCASGEEFEPQLQQRQPAPPRASRALSRALETSTGGSGEAHECDSMYSAPPTPPPPPVRPYVPSGLGPSEATRAFHSAVVRVIAEYVRRVLPAAFLVRARDRLVASSRASSGGQPPSRRGERSGSAARRRATSRERPTRGAGAATDHELLPPPLVSNLRFCVPADSRGTPLQGEPMREMELWVDLASWGRVHVADVPVPYDRDFRCAFPQILDAVLHRVPAGAAPPPTSRPTGRAANAPEGEAHRHVISLEIANEPELLADVATRVLHAGALHRA